jgi:hypothetical protein
VMFIVVNARERPAGGMEGLADALSEPYEPLPHRFDLSQRRLSWLTALAVAAITASALVTYASHAASCRS